MRTKAKGRIIQAELFRELGFKGEQKLVCNTDNFLESGLYIERYKTGTLKYTIKVKASEGEKTLPIMSNRLL